MSASAIVLALAVAVLAEMALTTGLAAGPPYCQPNDIAKCEELAGLVSNVGGQTSRYTVRNLAAHAPVSLVHDFYAQDGSITVFSDILPAGGMKTYTLTAPLVFSPGRYDLRVRASWPITIALLSPIRSVYLPAALVAPPTPTPTATPRPPNCDPSYPGPGVCIPPPPPKLNCDDVPYRNFRVLPPDPHDFDRDSDGWGCEDP